MRTTALTQADSGKSFPLELGDLVTITLHENATTGYHWAIEHLDEHVIAPHDTARKPGSATLGSGGQRVFGFKVVGAGSAQLRLKLWREWQGDASVTERFEARFQIQPS